MSAYLNSGPVHAQSGLGRGFNFCWVLLLSHDLLRGQNANEYQVKVAMVTVSKGWETLYHNRHLFLRKCETLEQRINP